MISSSSAIGRIAMSFIYLLSLDLDVRFEDDLEGKLEKTTTEFGVQE